MNSGFGLVDSIVEFEGIAFEKKGRNLYKRDGIYYRLFSHYVTSNGCWLVSPFMKEIVDIETSTGEDVYGSKTVVFEHCGTISSYNESVTVWS